MLPVDESIATSVARDLLRKKGYAPGKPTWVTKIEGQDVWYFFYDLPGQYVEIEVEYVGNGWRRTVTGMVEKT